MLHLLSSDYVILSDIEHLSIDGEVASDDKYVAAWICSTHCPGSQPKRSTKLTPNVNKHDKELLRPKHF